MSCPKADISGVWACGRSAGHLGGHLSAEAVEQIEAMCRCLNAIAANLATRYLKKPSSMLQMKTLLIAARNARFDRMLNGVRR